jgi:hypothetical protein
VLTTLILTRKSNAKYPYAHGFFVPPAGSSGYRTMMAYSKPGHEKRFRDFFIKYFEKEKFQNEMFY